ncbi:hypothetical protein HYPDE_29888 [Hyphomicrobium denitrificans 1NES1]|uniref:Uncharacterized protein n=1 Tax=Hyphomicrobium denitrificans 1NES1 TaxID=670307 RepID=N0B5Y1_9HYPH|nr:hypothetical protein [Hyphomicrobium denitrificans]AGK57652.1 hypothetical protein HYPDE_29888 [Hyphomicrobium denitrificans 1NES1]
MTRTLLLATAAFLLSVSGASAVGFLTQMNCASDYYAYCSQFQVGSKELRVCMRRAGPKLSKSCLNALIADGEVSKAEVEKTKQEILAAKNPAKQSPPVKQKGEEQKQKRTAVAKADDAPQATDARSRKEKKPVRETEVSQKTEKLTLNEQTFAALKQRQPKFIEEAAAEEMPKPRDPDKRARSSAAESASAKIDEPHAQHRTSAHKKKTAKKSKAETPSGHKKSKAKVAAKKEKSRNAKRSKRLAGE